MANGRTSRSTCHAEFRQVGWRKSRKAMARVPGVDGDQSGASDKRPVFSEGMIYIYIYTVVSE